MRVANNIDVRSCTAGDVPIITRTEHPSANYAVTTFARQQLGDCLYVIAWDGTNPVGSAEVEYGAPPELKESDRHSSPRPSEPRR
jgi:hypothetical protein